MGRNLSSGYAKDDQWPVGAALSGIFVIVTAHHVLGKKLNLEAYSLVLLIAIVARGIGNYTVLAHAGLSASLWGILIGIGLRTCCGLDLKEKGVFSGEFFVKVRR